MKKKTTKRPKTSGMRGIVAKLDRALSRYVRMSHADDGGTNECVTCGKLQYWKDSDCGHYIKRQHMSTRFDERNVAPQCKKCNRFAGGAMDEFAAYIMRAHGIEALESLMAAKHSARKWTHAELLDLVDKFESAAREHEDRISPV